jgi:hypothetical protein
MNQSIEDASRRDFEAAHKKLHGDHFNYRTYACGSYISAHLREHWDIWQASRQSSQSEPVAEVRYSDLAGLSMRTTSYGDSVLKQGDKLFLAAPQQAIPSGYATEYTPDMARTLILEAEGEEIPRMDEVAEILAHILNRQRLSASPTAPIESDK